MKALNPGRFLGENRKQFGEHLLAWYDVYARELPWRSYGDKLRDPYRVWVSEIMLQQTRVTAVIEHYHEFLRRFPTVAKLAAAREASVLAAWSGLGYYRRARMLHAAAKVIVRDRDGKFPATAGEWHRLPGIGRYTAAAIASIAFGEPVAVVDGNVERVLQRISGTRIAGEDLWIAAEQMLDRERPGDFNQAMMELGATVCTPRAPTCSTCPVGDLCATRGEMAGAAKAAPQKKREIHYALCTQQSSCRDSRPRLSGGPVFSGRSNKIFLVQRPRDARLMAGMWELPETARPGNHSRPFLALRHSITVTDYIVRVWNQAAPEGVQGKWVSVDRLVKIALTGLARKILKKAGAVAQREREPESHAALRHLK